MTSFPTDLFGNAVRPKPAGALANRYIAPPFSVLDAKQGYWQERKAMWLSLGLRSELGRDVHTLAPTNWDQPDRSPDAPSVFDPVLCECLYQWYTSQRQTVVDPFAGGSVRGIVAGFMQRNYWGCDLSADQIKANEKQASELRPDIMPSWVCGDSKERLMEAPPADFIFSCPPYGDLERYSDDPRDISTMEWHTFAAVYKHIIFLACLKLKNDRFAAFVVGNFRDGKRGIVRDLVSTTVSGFENAGVELYNSAILETPIGTAAMRGHQTFGATRKLITVHQHVLIFVKGDPRAAIEDMKLEEAQEVIEFPEGESVE
jgi:hypothetical protein